MNAVPSSHPLIWPREAGDEADRAILRTLAYASLFQSTLTVGQLHRRLMDVRLGLAEVRVRLAADSLRGRIGVTGGRVHLRGGERWVEVGEGRRRRSQALVAAHRRVLGLMSGFPFVRHVALSGGCAHDNATDDDVDVFVIVRRGRAWGVTLALMAIAKLLGKRRTLCLNYVLADDALSLPEHDLFTAAEIVGLRPLAGGEAHRRFVEANSWVAARFPNFFDGQPDCLPLPGAGAPAWIERLLDLGPAPVLERLARRVLERHFRRQWGEDREGVVLTASRLKLHPVDHGPRLRAALEETVRALGLPRE